MKNSVVLHLIFTGLVVAPHMVGAMDPQETIDIINDYNGITTDIQLPGELQAIKDTVVESTSHAFNKGKEVAVACGDVIKPYVDHIQQKLGIVENPAFQTKITVDAMTSGENTSITIQPAGLKETIKLQESVTVASKLEKPIENASVKSVEIPAEKPAIQSTNVSILPTGTVTTLVTTEVSNPIVTPNIPETAVLSDVLCTIPGTNFKISKSGLTKFGIGAVAIVTIGGVSYILYKNGTFAKIGQQAKKHPYIATGAGLSAAALCAGIIYCVVYGITPSQLKDMSIAKLNAFGGFVSGFTSSLYGKVTQLI